MGEVYIRTQHDPSPPHSRISTSSGRVPVPFAQETKEASTSFGNLHPEDLGLGGSSSFPPPPPQDRISP